MAGQLRIGGGNVPLEAATKGIDSGFFMWQIIQASGLHTLHWNILSPFHKLQCQLVEPSQVLYPFTSFHRFPQKLGELGFP